MAPMGAIESSALGVAMRQWLWLSVIACGRLLAYT